MPKTNSGRELKYEPREEKITLKASMYCWGTNVVGNLAALAFSQVIHQLVLPRQCSLPILLLGRLFQLEVDFYREK